MNTKKKKGFFKKKKILKKKTKKPLFRLYRNKFIKYSFI